MFKVIRSNIQTAITTPRIVRFRSNFAQSFIKSQTVHYEVQGQRSRSQQNVTYQQSIRCKMATDRLSDFELATGNVLKRIETARHRAASSCNAFTIAMFSSTVYDSQLISQLMLMCSSTEWNVQTPRQCQYATVNYHMLRCQHLDFVFVSINERQDVFIRRHTSYV